MPLHWMQKLAHFMLALQKIILIVKKEPRKKLSGGYENLKLVVVTLL
jgi:hypothetical protein